MKFDAEVGFGVYESTDPGGNAIGIITLQCGETDYMLCHKGGGFANKPHWTPNPRLAGSLTVGTNSPQGWIKINSLDGGEVWHGPGKATLHYKWPNAAPKAKQYLGIEAVSGSCIQLEHVGPGVTGVVKFYDCSNVCQSLTVTNGLITAGPGLTAPTGTGTVTCDDNQLDDWNPCA